MEEWRNGEVGGWREKWGDGGRSGEMEGEVKEWRGKKGKRKRRDEPTYWLHALLFYGTLDELGVSGGR